MIHDQVTIFFCSDLIASTLNRLGFLQTGMTDWEFHPSPLCNLRFGDLVNLKLIMWMASGKVNEVDTKFEKNC